MGSEGNSIRTACQGGLKELFEFTVHGMAWHGIKDVWAGVGEAGVGRLLSSCTGRVFVGLQGHFHLQ